jgi:murein L,D-transpeptidase YcbB/YkuD
VSEFQRRNGIPVTGVADRATFNAIYLEYLKATRERRRLYSPDLFPALPEGYVTEFGERSPFIAALEFVLDEIRVAYDTLPTFERDGTYDGDTALAVKEFQRIHGLPVTGRVDRITWNELGRAYDSYVRSIE